MSKNKTKIDNSEHVLSLQDTSCRDVYFNSNNKENISLDRNYYRYSCNCYKQNNYFENVFKKNKNEKIQFYVIHAKAEQCPEILPQRFFNEHINDNDNNSIFEILQIPQVDNIDSLKIKTLYQIFSFFNEELPKEACLESLFNSKTLQKKKYITINFIVESRQWEIIHEFIEFFINDFCKNQIKKTKLRFIFFWSIIYTSEIKDNSFFSLDSFRETKKDKIQKCIKNLEFDVLPEIQIINLDDIRTWIKSIELGSKINISLFNILNKEFSLTNKKEFTMEEVLEMFDFLSEKYNILNNE
ncbi:MAG: hypothetical protein B6I24_09415 [Bacteroidetes bacterium 4572_128]|nr:MAG: hypothetical protein B6I24_09415 [Bacteroidetes bacterium 4572_128]